MLKQHIQKGQFVEGQNNTEVMQLFVVMAAAIFGPSMASLIGPYMLIAAAAATGAAWSLGSRDNKGKVDSLLYFVRIVLTAILLTVAISKVAAGFIPHSDSNGLMAPVALIIGLIGDHWYKVGDWLIEAAKRFINSKTGGN